MMRILVTGAAGFLGRSVVEELLKQGYFVRALVRCKQKCPSDWGKNGVECLEKDLRYGDCLSEWFSGIDAVIHLAASKSSDADEQFESAVVGTEKLLHAMSQSQTKRLIFCSSISVYDFHEIGIKLSENSPLEKNLYERDGYAIAKTWQERVVLQMAKQYSFETTIFRPAMLWKEGSKEYPLVLSVPLGRVHVVIGPLKRANLLDVESCAKKFVDALKSTASIHQVYNLFPESEDTAWAFMGKFLKGKKAVRFPLPYWPCYWLIKGLYQILKLMLGTNLKIPSLFVPKRFEARFRPFKI